MSDSLTPPLLADNRSALVTDLVGVIDAEVADQSGLSGAAVKTAYAAVQKVKPGVVRSATDQLAEDFLTALAPFWDTKPAGVAFGDHLSAHGDPAAEALLAVTDARPIRPGLHWRRPTTHCAGRPRIMWSRHCRG